MSKAGDFEIKVWEGGHPIWATLHHRGKEIGRINSLELRSLGFAVKEARREAKQIARRMDPDRVQDY